MGDQHGRGFPATVLPSSEAAGSASGLHSPEAKTILPPLEDRLPTPMLQPGHMSQVTISSGPGVTAGDLGSFELQSAFPSSFRLGATTSLPSWSQTSRVAWRHLGNSAIF